VGHGSRDEETLLHLGARELAACIRKGEKTASEVVEAHISRIEAVNGRLNALVVQCFDAGECPGF
jgi:Asp-tRNA(Asn)/Glu-tRNA(Gln) amidotransferase A subunit family amidase